jgi:hypothetical protein
LFFSGNHASVRNLWRECPRINGNPEYSCGLMGLIHPAMIQILLAKLPIAAGMMRGKKRL